MDIVFLTHPGFLEQQSMPRFAYMLANGMKDRGHHVEIWAPAPVFFRMLSQRIVKKWLGYIDQYLVFPAQAGKRIKLKTPDTLFVFTDHALGPWVPLAANRPHVIHCHDFLAQRSALGEIMENRTGATGRLYQKYIRRGYSRGKNFVSVSKNTRDDLHRFLPNKPLLSEVVYNGLNQNFKPLNPAQARTAFGNQTGLQLQEGYLLHIGGNTWYKNRPGVIEIYNAWRSAGGAFLPLLMIGKAPDAALLKLQESSAYKNDIHFLCHIDDESVQLAYTGARVFLFPSYAEGFGWPVAEGLAAGCPVITTNEAPMTEVAGRSCFLIPRRPNGAQEAQQWAEEAAKEVEKVIKLSPQELKKVVDCGLRNARRFNADVMLNKMEAIYHKVLSHENT